jgi:glycosyltransferase involved in cell wall biosynthesis
MPEPTPLPPVATQPLSVVLLAHNDAAHLEKVVSDWLAYLDGLQREYEVILVDDGSTDGTGGRAAGLAERRGRLHVIRHPTHQGEGAALRSGLARARYPLVFYTLCDPRYRPNDLEKLLKHIDQVHLISGYRAGRPVPLFLRAAGLFWRVVCRVLLSYKPERLPGWLGWKGHAGRMLVRVLFGVRYHDVACPYRLFRRDILPRIPIQSHGSFAHVELLAKANALGHYLGEEVPLTSASPEATPGHPGDSIGQLFAEGYRLLNHPDFGPAILPGPERGDQGGPPAA